MIISGDTFQNNLFSLKMSPLIYEFIQALWESIFFNFHYCYKLQIGPIKLFIIVLHQKPDAPLT